MSKPLDYLLTILLTEEIPIILSEQPRDGRT